MDVLREEPEFGMAVQYGTSKHRIVGLKVQPIIMCWVPARWL